MLSSTLNTHNPIFLTNNDSNKTIFTTKTLLKPSPRKTNKKTPTATTAKATLIPSSPTPANQQLYQPFRPPPSPLPSQYRSLDAAARFDILANRLGLWCEYAPLIPSLYNEGFTPTSIEEATGVTGVEQNRLVVAAQVRESLIQSNTDPEIVLEFDTGGAELLYEIRLLSATQRAAAAKYIIQNKFDAKGAQDLARAVKDFPRRRGEKAWECFDYALPGDCLSFMYFRQSREHRNPSEQRTNMLEMALGVVESEKAEEAVLKELEGDDDGKSEAAGDIASGVRVPIVRMLIGEVAEAKSVVVLPVCRSEERERDILAAPWECRTEGHFGIIVAGKGWERWVVLPGWEPVAGFGKGGRGGGIVVAFNDARVLPWKVNRWYKEEGILVVADRGRKEVNADGGFYLVAFDGNGDSHTGGLKVERGSALKARGVEESLGAVVLVVRPPRENDDQLSDEDWE